MNSISNTYEYYTSPRMLIIEMVPEIWIITSRCFILFLD
jgi:hypothetical protein